MPEPRQVYICPACKRYLPIDEADSDRPVCRTNDCERDGERLNRMYMCPACEKCFVSMQQVKQHGKAEHQ